MKDKHKTQVLFLIHKDETETEAGDVFAYFPKENYNREGTLKASYAHIGQHSACSPEYANESRQATREEYDRLKNELQYIGYNLHILNK